MTLNRRPRKSVWWSLLLAGCWALAGMPGYAQSPAPPDDTQRSRLEELNRNLDQEKKTVKEITSAARSVFSALQVLEHKLDALRGEAKRLKEAVEQTDEKIRRSEQAIQDLSARAERQEKYLRARVVAAYKYHQQSYFEILFRSQDFPRWTENLSHLRRVMDYDRRVYLEYQRTSRTLEEEKQLHLQNRQELIALSHSLKNTKLNLGAEETQKKSLLSEILEKKNLHLKIIRELQEASSSLKTLIEKKESEQVAAPSLLPGDFMAQKGRLPMPVAGEILTRFGRQVHPIFKTVIFQKGIDIQANYLDEIRAVFPGEVIYAGEVRGYGKLLIIMHREKYYTLYAHAAELKKKVGDQAAAGEVIALVGDTGSLQGPGLYFEIRHHGQPVDPGEWLHSTGHLAVSGKKNKK